MKKDDIDYGDFGMGWWLYFELRLAGHEPEFKQQFIEELEKNFLRGDDVVGKNGQTKKRVAVRRVRKQIP